MNWGQFFLGLVAICVATIVYRWQKAVDRETSILAERRDLYARYLASSKEVYLSQPYVGVGYSPEELNEFFNISKAEISNFCLRDQIFLLAPKHVVDVVERHDRALRDWKISFPQGGFEGEDYHGKISQVKAQDAALRKAYNEMMRLFRDEIIIHSDISLRSFFKLGMFS